jgi:uncharacterized protein YkwD
MLRALASIRRRLALLVVVTNGVACAGAAPVRFDAPARTSTAPSQAGRREGARPSAVTSRQRDCPASAILDVVARCNAARRGAHLSPLVADSRLARAAKVRASTMAASNRLSHAGWERTVRGDVDGTIGENIAYNYPTADAVTRGWLASPGHRANIMHASFRRIGVGCIIDPSGKRWWTQDFAD